MVVDGTGIRMARPRRTGGDADAITASCAGLLGRKKPVIGFLRPIQPTCPGIRTRQSRSSRANPSPVTAWPPRGKRAKGLDGADFDEILESGSIGAGQRLVVPGPPGNRAFHPAGQPHIPRGGPHIPRGEPHIPRGEPHIPRGGPHIPRGGPHLEEGFT